MNSTATSSKISSTEALENFFITTRNRTEALCENLRTEDYTAQADYFVSPPKWHLAHTTWFFEEMILCKAAANYEVFDDSYGFLFNSYYNSVGERIERHQRGLITRPSVDEVLEYRAHVNEAMMKFIEQETDEQFIELIILGLNHEQQHHELLITDLKYSLSINPNYPKINAEILVNDKNENANWIEMQEGIYEIGFAGNGFCFDNELGRHKVFLESFEISNALVTNAEYIEFIESGAYQNPLLWLDEGWAWVNENEIKQPLYWHKKGDKWMHYTISGLQQIDEQSILSHVSFYEAAAFAHYKGMRLPTEFEWEAASSQFNWGKRWEWTNSAYLPYPRFKIQDGAVGEYNGKFMINQMVLRGASVATAEGHSRASYRNFFHPQMQWQLSGIRLAK